ncbi:carboxylesterase 3B-like [Aplysia californica]|uniref:Carboxylesterase 3B-like n=1 Tax=Aplysia californica TaxID=6500 RepID=A0ABM1A393_APLCA|nr:carboxylesterase 3B-like [Aplysia californica]
MSSSQDICKCLAFLASIAVIRCAPEIQFDFGKVQGVDSQAQDTSQPYDAYYGIPFAEPPVGNRRFQPPEPYQGRDPTRVISSDR